jgi:diguanylate cyclase (GGDEF)-like protein/PAS domain S-box-containing protein
MGAPTETAVIAATWVVEIRGIRTAVPFGIRQGRSAQTAPSCAHGHEVTWRIVHQGPDADALLRLCEVATDLLCICGFDGRFKLLNPAWEASLGWSRTELTSRPFLQFCHPDDLERTEAVFAKLLQGQPVLPRDHFRNRYRCANGGYRWLLWSATSSVEEQIVYATAQDVTDQVDREEELVALRDALEYQVRTDSATGLLNRRGGDEVLSRELARGRRYQNPATIVLFDIDHFKRINDTFGHNRGDLVIGQVASALRAQARESDAIIRWGGDEFIAVLPGVHAAGGRSLATRVREAISAPATDGMIITLSAGVTEIRLDDDVDALIGRADRLMYEAKAAGRDQLIVRQPGAI